MLDWLKEFIYWLCAQSVAIGNSLLQPIADAMPDLSGDIGLIYQYAGVANTWVALDYAFILLGSWFVVIGLIILVKWILGLVPTVS